LPLDNTQVNARPYTGPDIFLDDVTVSRKHAEFVRDDGQFTVRDVGSLNGTYVNRTRIDEVVLQAGDEVQIGKYRLTFHPSPRRGEASAKSSSSPAERPQQGQRPGANSRRAAETLTG